MTKVELDTIVAYENYRVGTIIDMLKHYDNLYYNEGSSPISDEEYDTLRRLAQDKDPTNVYFTGVGSAVRGGKIVLPFPMGSLDQIYDGDYAKWVTKHDIYNSDLVITEKLDGVSALVVYGDDGKLQIAYSRGDGIQGADITRHLRKFQNLPTQLESHTVIRGEIIFDKISFLAAKRLVRTRGGKEYKNARNMVAGLMNAESNDDEVYSHINFIAYELIQESEIGTSKWEQIQLLLKQGFKVPRHCVYKAKDLNGFNMPEILEDFKSSSFYEIDGLVIEVDGALQRSKINPSKDTLNPAYAVKYKMASEDNFAIARVEKVEWNVSKHGYLKPRVRISPIDLVGVTITYATGFNAKFISDNNIGPGSKIQITRSGDVIPFIQSVLEGTTAQMPTEDWEWNETKVDAVMSNHHESEEVVIKQALHFFSTINVPNLKEGVITKMYNLHNYTSFDNCVIDLCNYKKDYWYDCIGVNGEKIYDGLRKVLGNIGIHTLLGATPYFGRGVGVRKFKKLIEEAHIETIDDLACITKTQMLSVDGIEEKTAEKIFDGLERFDFLFDAIPYIHLTFPIGNVEGKLSNEKIVFSGFRDKELVSQVEAEGGTMQSGVSGKTTILVVKDPDANTSKIRKARERGVKVLSIQYFKEIML